MSSSSSTEKKLKGRGHEAGPDNRYEGEVFERIDSDSTESGGPQRSIEGWVIIITGVHEEAVEEDLRDLCAEYGTVKNLQLPLDRQTGFIKGYAFVEYAQQSQAEEAIQGLDQKQFRERNITADWAFVAPPPVK